ncbi:hypothetical protein [Celeribacter halophilus]|uniref:hypothetical protein n=1 Tax=Celeribacter halophilus TaxID=576117 RepID=UPI003A956CBE
MTIRINFDKVTKYHINGAPYIYENADGEYAYFRRDDGLDVVERFDWETLQEIVASPRWNYEKLNNSVAEAKAQPVSYACHEGASKTQKTLVCNRWFFVCGINRLYAKGGLILKPEHVAEQYQTIKAYAAEEWAAYHEVYEKRYFSSKNEGFSCDASPQSILRWRRAVEAAGGRIDALFDRRGRASKINIDQDSFLFIQQQLRELLLNQQHSGREVVEKTIQAVREENKRRAAEGRKQLETRGKTALTDWLGRFDRFEVDASRKGLAFAKHKYLGVGKTGRATRPGQAFAMDEWEVDGRTICLNGPIREGLDQKTIDQLPRGRRWLYVVIDVATRYIVGLVVASSQNSEAAIRALEMATRDKPDLAAATGAQCDWRGFPFESIESDTGPGFRAGATLRAVKETHATYTYANVGEPHLRAVIERVFGTISKRAMPYIPGRTFSNPKERGDYPTEKTAVLTDDQLALIFIRYVVDVYHQTPHRGLFGETPADALERLGGTVGLPPQLPRPMRRRAFGIPLERTVTARGITVLGISYNSEMLQTVRRRPKKEKILFYFDPRDLGTISVQMESERLEVDCSIENFHGVTLDEWIEVGHILRPRYAASAALKTDIIADALAAMRARANEAMRIMGVLPQQATSEDIKRLESELYLGISVVEDDTCDLSDLGETDDGIGYVITGFETESNEPTDEATPSTLQADQEDTDNQDDDPTWWMDGGDL